MTNRSIAVMVAAIVILVAGAAASYYVGYDHGWEGGQCTLEAKVCADGTAVGRTGPSCEFAKCPGEISGVWKTFTDEERGISFQYPERLLTDYVELTDWPPQVQILNEPFTCTEAGESTDRAGETFRHTVHGRVYCVTHVVEGAAGTVYTLSAYAFAREQKTVIFTFSLRAPQCLNYDDPQKTACLEEQRTFDMASIVDRMAQSFRLITPVPPASGTSGIRGDVRLGPTCPVVQYPPDPDCDDKPYAAPLAITSPNGTQIIKEFRSDADGKFTVSVPPGEYAIYSYPVANVLPYCTVNDIVRVTAGKYTEALVSCDTGIR